MNPSDLYASTLTSLYQAKSTLISEAWHDALNGATKQQKIDSSVKLVELANAITTWSNTQLNNIVKQMCDQQSALEAATAAVTAALKQIEKVQTVLDAITEIIGVVGQIVPLL